MDQFFKVRLMEMDRDKKMDLCTLVTEIFTLVNGLITSLMVLGFTFFLMKKDTKDIFKKENETAKELSIISMEGFTKENGRITKRITKAL